MKAGGAIKTVLAVGAHPDDIEISCSGTLKQLSDLGCTVHIASMTLGDCGSKKQGPAEICRVRAAEAERAAALVGARFHWAGSHDFAIFNDDVHNRRVTALIREANPDIVFTHPPQDYMLDHETTSVLVRNACFYAPAPNFSTSDYNSAHPVARIPHLYYFDVMEGIDIFGNPVVPQFYVDTSEQIDFKGEMLACHASQREWLREQHGMDEYLEAMRQWGRKRGAEASAASGRNVQYAEAFRQHLGHAYPRQNVLEALLPGRVIADPRYPVVAR